MEKIENILKTRLKDAPSTSKEADRGLLAIRIGIGVFFIYHGLGKFFGFNPEGGIETFAMMLSGIGFPVPIFWAYLVAFVELFGGIVVLLGFLTRVSSVFLAVIPLVAFVTVKSFSFGAGGSDLLTFAMAFSLLLAGPGKISFAERWYREEASKTREKAVVAREGSGEEGELNKSEEKREHDKKALDEKKEDWHSHRSGMTENEAKKDEKKLKQELDIDDIIRL